MNKNKYNSTKDNKLGISRAHVRAHQEFLLVPQKATQAETEGWEGQSSKQNILSKKE
jgi:hypothetical protein